MKKIIFPAMAAAVAILVSGCRQMETANCDAAVEQEKILVLEQELATLRKMQPKMVSLDEIFGTMTHNQLSNELVMRYLEMIEPPPDASPDRKRQYIYRLSRLGNIPVRDYNGLKKFVMARLAAQGREYLPDLLLYANSNRARFAAEAVYAMAKPEDKEILRGFALNQGRRRESNAAADLFLKFADQSDRDTVLLLLRTNAKAIAAVVRLGLEKEALPIVRQKLLTGERQNFDQLFSVAMRNMDDAGRSAFLREMWRNVEFYNRNRGWDVCRTAIEMASYGHLGALRFLMESESMYRSSQEISPRLLALGHFDKMEDMEAWYAENKDNLIFDSKEKIYKAVNP